MYSHVLCHIKPMYNEQYSELDYKEVSEDSPDYDDYDDYQQ